MPSSCQTTLRKRESTALTSEETEAREDAFERQLLATSFPLSGRVAPEFNLPQIREVLEGPYRIIYYIKPDQIDVIVVIHGARKPPWENERS